MKKLITTVCAVALLALLTSTAACLTCNTDQDCGSVGYCVNGTCQSPQPGQ